MTSMEGPDTQAALGQTTVAGSGRATVDRHHMQAALALGRRGLGSTWPNPSVGCVLVRDGRVVGRGTTAPGGRPHAEAVALAMAGPAARGATAYVTLEPCSHHGQTPPCADALVAAGVARVVIAGNDPDPRVDGAGIARLRAAGVEVLTGLLTPEADAQQAGFLDRIRSGRPMVTLKLATTLDGRIATRTGASQWITGPDARRAAHALRGRHDAVMVGIGTVLADDPDLTCRIPGFRRTPIVRIVLDSTLRTPPTARLVTTAADQPTWIIHGSDARRHPPRGVAAARRPADPDRYAPRGPVRRPARARHRRADPSFGRGRGRGGCRPAYRRAGGPHRLVPRPGPDRRRRPAGGPTLRHYCPGRDAALHPYGRAALGRRHVDRVAGRLMFTGIITGMGAVRTIKPLGAGQDMRIVIEAPWPDTASIPIGASVACGGCCLTAVEVGPDWFAVDASNETLSKTKLGDWVPGTRMNLERSLRLGDELGGHLVSGHVDGLGQVRSVTPENGSWRVQVEAPRDLARFIAQKGSVSLDGVSLTVNEVAGATFGVNIIPHTWTVTTLGQLQSGDPVHIEIDMLARYVARLQEAT